MSETRPTYPDNPLCGRCQQIFALLEEEIEWQTAMVAEVRRRSHLLSSLTDYPHTFAGLLRVQENALARIKALAKRAREA